MRRTVRTLTGAGWTLATLELGAGCWVLGCGRRRAAGGGRGRAGGRVVESYAAPEAEAEGAEGDRGGPDRAREGPAFERPRARDPRGPPGIQGHVKANPSTAATLGAEDDRRELILRHRAPGLVSWAQHDWTTRPHARRVSVICSRPPGHQAASSASAQCPLPSGGQETSPRPMHSTLCDTDSGVGSPAPWRCRISSRPIRGPTHLAQSIVQLVHYRHTVYCTSS